MTSQDGRLEIRWNPEQPLNEIKYMGDPPVAMELLEEIADLRKQAGPETVLLGHAYQRAEVIQFSDVIGDSLALSQHAAALDNIKQVVFLGVHFMAETADMLTPAEAPVILPDLRAGCTMADMAPIEDIEDAWRQLGSVINLETVTPITYINSTAAVKAHVGRHGGTICTSSNAVKIIKWGLDQGEKIFFFPDQHLGRNTSYKLGIPLDEMIVWDSDEPLGGNSDEAIRNARVILWRGWCSVHQHFQLQHLHYWRKRLEDINILVHPECNFDVVQHADYAGSTGYITRMIEEANPDSKWAVGTEHNLVSRLAIDHKPRGVEVYSLAPYACLCSTMFRITPEALRDSLTALLDGRHRHLITVDEEVKLPALEALNRMFEITAGY